MSFVLFKGTEVMARWWWLSFAVVEGRMAVEWHKEVGQWKSYRKRVEVLERRKGGWMIRWWLWCCHDQI